MTEKIEIREANIEDAPMIVDVMNDVFKEQQYFGLDRDINYWSWKHEQNIFGKSILIVAEKDSKIVGLRAFWSWRLKCRGQFLKAFQPVDTFVHPEYQGRGLFRKMNIMAVQKAIDNNADLIFNFPNKNSLPGNLSLGWNYVSKLNWIVKLISPVKVLRSLNSKDKAQSAEIPEDLAFTESVCNSIDVDTVFNGTFRTDYTKEYFKWRYARHPFFNYGIISTADGAKLVFTIIQKGSLNQIVVVDYIGSRKSIPELFRRLLERNRRLNGDIVISLLNNEMNLDHLWRHGYIKMKKKNFTVLPLNLALETKAVNLSEWGLVGGMHDSL